MVKKTALQKQYSDKFLNPKWQKFRLAIFERDGFMCVRCDDNKSTLHAHHTYYEDFGRDPWDYDEDCVITLCEECHSQEHKYLKQVNKQLLNTISSTGISWENKVCLAAAFEMLPKKLPVDFWDVMMAVFLDDSFYKNAQQIYYNDTGKKLEAVQKLRWEILELIMGDTNG